ncbi:MAG: glycine zipper 2TM domain-containing protein [Asticcacaulis sp.]|uniref:glycine zipper 2TM domain-containing protein n=1 Tax=Asticcacaulis sp. TaxID=1872648 RepID=UPI0039E5A27B
MALNTKTVTAGTAIILALAAGAPMAAQAQTQYDGYCYVKKGSNTTGTVVGAVAGGAIGSQVSKNERGLGTVAGAVLGGVIGNKVAKSNDKCLNGEYYSYQSGSYTPSYAPDGYDVVYYKSRPDAKMYDVVYYDTQRHTSPAYSYNNNSNGGYAYNQGGYNSTPYNQGVQGWRDDNGTWHEGRPVAFGWKDSKGRWHEGQLQAYGYRDSDGRWRETSASAYGYNNN